MGDVCDGHMRRHRIAASGGRARARGRRLRFVKIYSDRLAGQGPFHLRDQLFGSRPVSSPPEAAGRALVHILRRRLTSAISKSNGSQRRRCGYRETNRAPWIDRIDRDPSSRRGRPGLNGQRSLAATIAETTVANQCTARTSGKGRATGRFAHQAGAAEISAPRLPALD